MPADLPPTVIVDRTDAVLAVGAVVTVDDDHHHCRYDLLDLDAAAEAALALRLDT